MRLAGLVILGAVHRPGQSFKTIIQRIRSGAFTGHVRPDSPFCEADSGVECGPVEDSLGTIEQGEQKPGSV